jgi:hypothetical protein
MSETSSAPSNTPSASSTPSPGPNDFQLEQKRLAQAMLDQGVSDVNDLPGEVLDNFDPAVLEAGPNADI